MAQLVFIEGVSGVGKSTMTRALTQELLERGYRVRCYVEFDYTNPVDFYCTAYMTAEEHDALCREYPECAEEIHRNTVDAGNARLVRYYDEDTPLFPAPLMDELGRLEFCYCPENPVSLEAYSLAYRHVWRDYAAALDDSCDYILFDGSLLHHPLNDMMRNYDATAGEMAAHVRALLDGRRQTAYFLYRGGGYRSSAADCPCRPRAELTHREADRLLEQAASKR